MFLFEQISTGGDRNFGYLFGDTESKEAVFIDPSYDPDKLLKRASAQGVRPKWLLNTHSHHDHTNGNDVVLEAGAQLASSSKISFGKYTLDVISTPGHCADHVVFYEPTFQIAITGDHLFVGKIGGTADEESARQQYESLLLLLRELPKETIIWPGHDVGVRPSSTLQIESATNPFLLVSGVSEFLALKENWPTFKKERGLL